VLNICAKYLLDLHIRDRPSLQYFQPTNEFCFLLHMTGLKSKAFRERVSLILLFRSVINCLSPPDEGTGASYLNDVV